MWYSIQSVVKPQSFKAAWEAKRDAHQAFFAGGSYLVAERNQEVKVLIDLNGLLDRTLDITGKESRLGAGITLQSLLEAVSRVQPESVFVKALRYSCPSKNIRNQRTLGGEIACGRADSEVLVFLQAVSAELSVHTDQKYSVPLQTWKGDGILSEVFFNTATSAGAVLERFAVIPSAPAVLIAAGVRRDEAFVFTVGGRVDKVFNLTVPSKDWDPSRTPDELARGGAEHFHTDHWGSVAYKQKLLAVALRRVGGQL